MKKLDPIHDRAIDLLLTGHRQYEIAAELKISERTVRRWIKDEAFREELETQRDGARTMAQTVMALNAVESATFVANALNAVNAMLNSHDEKTHERGIELGLKMQAHQERLASQEKWREFANFDKLKRKEAGKNPAPQSEAVPTVPQEAAESGQNRTIADTPTASPAEPTAETGQERTKPDTSTPSTPGQNRTNPDTEPPIVVKEAKFTSVPKKPNFKAPNKAPFYVRVAGRK